MFSPILLNRYVYTEFMAPQEHRVTPWQPPKPRFGPAPESGGWLTMLPALPPPSTVVVVFAVLAPPPIVPLNALVIRVVSSFLVDVAPPSGVAAALPEAVVILGVPAVPRSDVAAAPPPAVAAVVLRDTFVVRVAPPSAVETVSPAGAAALVVRATGFLRSHRSRRRVPRIAPRFRACHAPPAH